MGNYRCKWVRDRLPLLAGDELVGLDRRRVERHLIGCPGCRSRRIALTDALNFLHASSASSPASPEAPSLWPALARQIRESRRPSPAPAFAWPRWGWPVLGLSGLGVLAAIVMAVGFGPTAPAPTGVVARPRLDPVPSNLAVKVVGAEQSLHDPDAIPAPAPADERPRPDVDTTVFESPAPRLNYDLDRGTPMPVEPRDDRQPTY